MTTQTDFPAHLVVAFCTALAERGVIIWLDGGWAVDALLNEQTRPHSDLDITIQKADLPVMHQLLADWGYTAVPRDDTRPHNFVLGDDEGHLIDVHVIVLDEDGNGLYGDDDLYPAEALTGIGVVEGKNVDCISPAWLVKFHSGYPPRAIDFHDVRALCAKFGLELPEAYR